LSTLAKGFTVLAIILAIGLGLVVWKAKVGGHGAGHDDAAITKLTKEDMQNLLKDAPPMALKQLAENPELKQKQVDSIKEFLAVANQARKEGLADNPQIKSFLEFIRAQIVATNYDREKNKDKGSLPPFSFVKKEDVDAFYQVPGNEEKFNELVKALTEQGKEEAPDAPEPTPEQIQQLKEQYAKVKIYEKEAKEAKLGEEFERKTDLQVKLQQAAFLNQLYAEKVLKNKVKVTDEEVEQYIAAHPELDPKAKKAKADEISQRIKAGEDFDKLAKEFSEDPGSKDKGGLYENVKIGQMLPEFEQTALALEPGKVADNAVETKFGYHIIKLEKKGATKNKEGKDEETYDVRHILISTMFNDPKNPYGQPMPLSEKVKADLQEEKEKKFLDEIKASNPIVIEDFEVPKPTDEQIQQMQQQMMQRQMPMGNPEGMEGAELPTEPSAEAPKKSAPKQAPKK
jgi:parvulin-like peptidyl-prolyl isomerase